VWLAVAGQPWPVVAVQGAVGFLALLCAADRPRETEERRPAEGSSPASGRFP